MHFPFLNGGNRKASGLRLERNTAHRFVVILTFYRGEFLGWVGQLKSPVSGSCFVSLQPLCWQGRIKKRCYWAECPCLRITRSPEVQAQDFIFCLHDQCCDKVLEQYLGLCLSVCQELELLPFFFFHFVFGLFLLGFFLKQLQFLQHFCGLISNIQSIAIKPVLEAIRWKISEWEGKEK